MTLYSFKDLTGAFVHPLGTYIFGGGDQQGFGELQIEMATERTDVAKSADGSIMMSYIAGDNGSITVKAQQTSDVHAFFLNTFNACKTAADSGSVGLWAAGMFTARNLIDGSMHTCTGVTFSKVPPKVYGEKGQDISWMFLCAKIISE
jgi:hypothetical protein